LETTRSVEDNPEVASKWWSEGGGARFRVNLCDGALEQAAREPTKLHTDLVVDQTPLLQKSVHAHDGAYISCEIPPARSDGEVLCRPETVRVDHEVSIILVD
jgi:hypothetical protein